MRLSPHSTSSSGGIVGSSCLRRRLDMTARPLPWPREGRPRVDVRWLPEAPPVTRKPDRALTLHDRLSQLTFKQACKLLGTHGATLIRRGGAIELDVLPHIPRDAERVVLTVAAPVNAAVTVTFRLANDRLRRLSWRCSAC